MNNVIIVGLLAMVLVSALRFGSHKICLSCSKYSRQLISFLTGSVIMLMFMHLMNDIYRDTYQSGNELLLLFLPFGFIVFLFIEQHIYQAQREEEQVRELELTHGLISACMGFAIGVTLVTHLQASLFSEILILVMFVFYDMVDIMTLHSLHHLEKVGHKMKHTLRKILFSLTPVLGYAYGYYIGIEENTRIMMTAFLSGVVFHAVLKEIIPEEKKVIPVYFGLAVLLFLALFLVDIYVLRG